MPFLLTISYEYQLVKKVCVSLRSHTFYHIASLREAVKWITCGNAVDNFRFTAYIVDNSVDNPVDNLWITLGFTNNNKDLGVEL